jgi:CBS domain-containing protein
MVACVKTIEQFLRSGSRILTIEPEATVAVAAKEMRDHRVGCLMVVNLQRRIIGVLGERDIVARVVAKGLDPADVCVRDVMTREVRFVGRDTTIEEAGRTMARANVRHLPIVEGGAPVGMISSRDVLLHQLATANAKARKGRRVLQELEDEHPGITRLQVDNSGRIVI